MINLYSYDNLRISVNISEDNGEHQAKYTPGMPTRKGALFIFFLGLITLSDRSNTQSVCLLLERFKKND
jgi:hypothetical protein